MNAPDRPLRLLIVLPSWVGDAVMATPALVRIRQALPGAFIGALARPGIDRLLDGLATPDRTPVFDEFHAAHATGVLGPKFVAAKIRPRRYDTALLLTGSFSTALTVRVAGVPRRIGYDRDARGLLLTRRLHPPKRPDGGWAVVPAVSYYWHAASALLDPGSPDALPAPPLTDLRRVETTLPPGVRLTLPLTERDEADAQRVRASAGLARKEPFAILNPGGNNPAKRWPADRFAALGSWLAEEHGFRVLVNGSPAEGGVCREIADGVVGGRAVCLADHAHTLGALKVLCRDAALMVTNDTGPRHIAAAMNTPLVSLFGPTDPRWTTIPVPDGEVDPRGEIILVADPSLPPGEVANDHAERCRVDRIGLDEVRQAAARLLG
jgi:heptosyltransferase-2